MNEHTKIQVLDPTTHTLIGVMWTSEEDETYLRAITPTGYPALVETPHTKWCLLPSTYTRVDNLNHREGTPDATLARTPPAS